MNQDTSAMEKQQNLISKPKKLPTESESELKARIVIKFSTDSAILLRMFKLANRLITALNKFYNIAIDVEEIFQGVIFFFLDENHLDKLFKLGEKIQLNHPNTKSRKNFEYINLLIQIIRIPDSIDQSKYIKRAENIVKNSNGDFLIEVIEAINENKYKVRFPKGSFFKQVISTVLKEKF
jgi:hypothetical protein